MDFFFFTNGYRKKYITPCKKRNTYRVLPMCVDRFVDHTTAYLYVCVIRSTYTFVRHALGVSIKYLAVAAKKFWKIV